ncbi:MAG: aldo/keto reductase [Campylobacterota bacterium]|nr:aldo/keto reductase [Campylobacterota bacterium]
MSNFAFGTYRITDQNPQHIQALREAIDSGITMIDTSSNYMDGAAERAIAFALRDFDDETKARVEIVSKYGYIQGSNMESHKEESFEGVVEFSEHCFHSISPSFMRNQLKASLSRLELSKLDCYLVHNPEYYILDALNRDAQRDEVLDAMYDRLYEAFVGLEEEVKTGRIGSYGVSSNSFSKANRDPEFLPYEDLITLADRASESVGNDTHSFTTIQLPINILETEGLKCASWAKANGLRVLVNRPLNAQKDGRMFRLADYDESAEYYHHLNELLDVCDNDELKPIYNLLEQLDENKHKFGWVGDFDSFLYAQILPHIKSSLEDMDAESLETMLKYIDMFFIEYRKMVSYECSKNTRVVLKELFSKCEGSLQECSLKFLIERESIDYILVGMRKPSYVQEVLALKA